MRTRSVNKLRKIVVFLRTLPPEKFNYNKYVTDAVEINGTVCGTVCCAAGWCPTVFPRQLSWRKAWRSMHKFDVQQVQKFLGLTDNEFGRLFVPDKSYFGYYGYYSRSHLLSSATVIDVADHIERCANDMGNGIDITTSKYTKWMVEYNNQWSNKSFCGL